MNETACVIEGKYLQIAQHESYLELTNRVCWYDRPNLNGTQLDWGTSKEAQKRTLKKAQTLKMMPVQAKYKVNENGEPTLGGHEVKMVNGVPKFGTASIGVHEAVWVQEEEVEMPDGQTVVLPCLYAKSRIWKRYENCISAIRRLFEAGELKSSWEIECSKYEVKDGIKYLRDYEFIGNALLDGVTNPPAYSSAGVIDIAQQSSSNLMVAEALAADIQNLNESEVKAMPNIAEDFEVEIAAEETTEEVVEETVQETSESTEQPQPQEVEESEKKPEEEEDEQEDEEEKKEESQCGDKKKEKSEEEVSEVEVSMLTDRDTRRALEKALATNENPYPWVCMMFPNEKLCWVKDCGETKELEYVEVAYEVNGNELEIVSQTPVELVASPRAMSASVAEKDNEISELKNEVAELRTIKEKYDAQIAEQEKAEHEAKVAELRSYAEKSGYFSEDELNGEEFASLFETLNATEIKSRIADKVMAGKEQLSSKKEESEVKTEVSEAAPKIELNYDTEETSKKRSLQWSKFLNA